MNRVTLLTLTVLLAACVEEVAASDPAPFVASDVEFAPPPIRCDGYLHVGNLVSCDAYSLEEAFEVCGRMHAHLLDPALDGWPDENDTHTLLQSGGIIGGYLRIAALSHDPLIISASTDEELELPQTIEDMRWQAAFWEPQLALRLGVATLIAAEDIGLSTDGGSALCTR